MFAHETQTITQLWLLKAFSDGSCMQAAWQLFPFYR